MVKLADLYKVQADTVIEWAGHEITISFHPGQVTATSLGEVLDVESGRTSHEWLAEMISGWNLTDDDGEELPITDESMQSLPYSLVAAFVRALRLWNTPTEGE